MREILLGLAYVHSEGIIHKDIKPQNIMLEYEKEGEFPAKIVDFGLASLFSSKSQTLCGTPHFMAPEVWKSGTYTSKVDIWGCGIMMFMLLNGSAPFTGITNIRELKKEIKKGMVFESVLEQLKFLSPAGKDILSLMLQNDCGARPSAHSLLSHKWFSSQLMPEIPIETQQGIIKNMQVFRVLN